MTVLGHDAITHRPVTRRCARRPRDGRGGAIDPRDDQVAGLSIGGRRDEADKIREQRLIEGEDQLGRRRIKDGSVLG